MAKIKVSKTSNTQCTSYILHGHVQEVVSSGRYFGLIYLMACRGTPTLPA